MNPPVVAGVVGKLACALGIASYCYATLQLFIFGISKEEFSKHPEVIYFSVLASIWGALPFLFLWFLRRRAYSLASQIVLCLAALTAAAFESWKLSLVLPHAATNASAVGEVLASMPLYIWPISIGAILTAEILYRL